MNLLRLLFFTVLVLASTTRADGNPVHILCIGDSITQADQETLSWRYWLWETAVENNVPVDFAGPFDRNYLGNPDWPQVKGLSFDSDHAAQWGWTANKVADHLPKWLEEVDADVALIHLGTNDLLLGQGAASTVRDLEQIVGILREDNPRIRILVAQIIPSASIRDFTAFNRVLAEAAKGWSTEVSPVKVVDCFTGFDVASMTYDGLHPFGKGEELIAERFWEGLKPWVRKAADDE